MRLVGMVREGSYTFYGATETTMSHGEGWRFVQLGKFTERACAISMLLDAYFSTPTQGRRSGLGDAAGQLRRVRVVLPRLHRRSAARSHRRRSCSSIRSSRTRSATRSSGCTRRSSAIVENSTARKRVRIERIIGRLRASLGLHADVGADGRRSARVPQRRARPVRRAAPAPCTRRTSITRSRSRSQS